MHAPSTPRGPLAGRGPAVPRRIGAALLLLGLAAAALPRLAAPRSGAALPAIVFVSRTRPGGAGEGQIPGLGPGGRTLEPGGRLMIRDSGGAVRELLPRGALFDVSDPAVSPDARRVAFAGTPAPDSAWRILVVGLDGRGLAPVTAPLPGRRADDFDPCWMGDWIVFASTRYPQSAQYDGGAVTNLFAVRADGGAPVRLTSERNGAEEPCFDARRGTLVYARWWFNRFRPSDHDPGGLAARAPGDSGIVAVDLWQAVECRPFLPPVEGGVIGLSLATGAPDSRLAEQCYQPALLPDGRVLGVYARNFGLAPDPGGVGIQSFTRGGSRRLAGALVSETPGDPYRSARGLAAPSACSPAALPDGRVVYAFDPGARGDFGLWVMRADGSGAAPLVDLPGTLELDPAPVVRQPAPRAARAPAPARAALRDEPAREIAALRDPARAFRYLSLGVFLGQGAATAVPGARLRFFATLARPAAAGGDTAVLLREVEVGPGGRVDEAGLPADTPLFEQLVDAHGRVLATRHGPAQVAGLNVGSAFAESRCLGCHLGHSTLRAGSGR